MSTVQAVAKSAAPPGQVPIDFTTAIQITAHMLLMMQKNYEEMDTSAISHTVKHHEMLKSIVHTRNILNLFYMQKMDQLRK
jgi:hypothetical protein